MSVAYRVFRDASRGGARIADLTAPQSTGSAVNHPCPSCRSQLGPDRADEANGMLAVLFVLSTT